MMVGANLVFAQRALGGIGQGEHKVRPYLSGVEVG